MTALIAASSCCDERPTVSRAFPLMAALLAMSGVHCVARAEAPKPQDIPYDGTITLSVDATDVSRRLFRVHETIPVKPGDLVLQYAKWLPGNHAPSGPIDQLAGLSITGGGRPMEWTRDPLDVYSFDVTVPEGVSSLELDLQFASPETTAQG